MDLMARDRHLARIINGSVPLTIGGCRYFVKAPSREARLIAAEIYEGVLTDLAFDGLFSEEGLEDFLFNYDLWTIPQQEELDTLTTNIENLKVDLYNYIFKARERGTARKLLEISKKRYDELTNIKHSYDYLSLNGVATLIKAQYLIYAGLYSKEGKVFDDEAFWATEDEIVFRAFEQYNRSLLKEADYREISRTEPWRGTWNLSNDKNFFNCSVLDYTDEQRILVMWSCLYDRIFESHNCPADDVIEDDDMLDGWMIIQRRKRDDEMAKKRGEEQVGGNAKINNSDEIYVVAQTPDDAKKVDKLNDDISKMIKKRRWAAMEGKDAVSETDLPDVKEKYAVAANQRIRELMKRK